MRGSYAFCNCTSLTSVTIGNSVTSIGYYTFNSCTSLKDVNYGGSESDWDKIKIDSNNEPLNNATIHYNYVGGSTVPTACNHSKTKIVNKKSATYFAKGYTGDKVCADCGKVISKGKSTAMLKLKTPSNLKLKAGKKAVTVSFNKVTGAKKYQVYYKVGNKAKTITTTKLKLTIKKLTSKKKYSIKVRAVVTSGKKTATSNWSTVKKQKLNNLLSRVKGNSLFDKSTSHATLHTFRYRLDQL